jgi:hypothetical protein
MLRRSLWCHLTAPQWAQEVKEGSACDFPMLVCSSIDVMVHLDFCDVMVILGVAFA